MLDESNKPSDNNTNVSALIDLYTNLNVLFCIAESDGYFTLLNPYWTQVLGWTLDELKAKPFMEFVHPDDRPSTDDQADRQFIDHESVTSFINRYRTKDGQYRWLEWTAKSPNGGVIYAVAHDITEKKEKEAQLRLVQDRLEELVQNVPGAFFQYIVHDNGDHTVQYMSPGSKDIWGLTPEEIGEDPSCLWALILPEDIEPLQASIEKSLVTLSRWEQEYRIALPSGEIRWLRGVGTPRRLASGGTFWNSLVMDMTQLRDQQNTIAKMQRMEMIGHLASGVSHDFNNILAIIEGHRQLLGMKTSDVELTEHIEIMEVAIKRAQKLTRRLLMSSKKTMAPTNHKVPISTSLKDTRALLDEITPANIQVIWQIDDNCRSAVENSEFDDVVTNLFINARNALDKNGQIIIRLSPQTEFTPASQSYVQMKPDRAKRYSVLSVIDNGCGIPRDDFERIFIPFVSNSHSGTGLGLAMAVGFASRYGCGITLKSQPGEGTEISIWVPHNNNNTLDEEAHEDTLSARNRSYKILLIDDEMQFLRVVQEMLKLKGHQVIPFHDSAEARAWLLDHHAEIDMVLTDEIMPGQIQGHDIHAEFNDVLPVLIMSGYLDIENYDTGHLEVLQKPVSLKSLEEAIERIMSSPH